MICNKLQRKGAQAAAVAAILLLAACGKQQPEPDAPTGPPPSVIPSGPGEGQDGELPSTIPGNIAFVNSSDEELAKTEVVLDSITEDLMYQGLYYRITGEDTVTAVDYYDVDLAEIDFPDALEYDGKSYRVTEVAEDAFSYCYDLAKVSFGKNIQQIGNRAFQGCYDLGELVFSTGLVSIGDNAFESCEALVEAALPDGLKSIGSEAFCSCYALKDVRLPEGLETVGANLFFDCTDMERIELPASLKSVSYGMFTNCYALSEVVLPEGLTVIEREAFWSCESMKDLQLPESLVYIGDKAFYSAGLARITMPEKQVSLGEDIFSFCNDLETVYVREASAEFYEAAFDGEPFTVERLQ